MKSALTLASITLLFAGTYSFVRMLQRHRGTSISVTESNKMYSYKARFPVAQSKTVSQYIDEVLSPSPVFNGEEHFSGEINMGDTAHFSIDASEGRVELSLNKRENTAPSFVRIKSMAESISAILSHKK